MNTEARALLHAVVRQINGLPEADRLAVQAHVRLIREIVATGQDNALLALCLVHTEEAEKVIGLMS